MNDPRRSFEALGVLGVGGLESDDSAAAGPLLALALEVNRPRRDFLLPLSPLEDNELDCSGLDRSLTGSSGVLGARTGLLSAEVAGGESIFSLLLERNALESRDLSVPVFSSRSESCLAS